MSTTPVARLLIACRAIGGGTVVVSLLATLPGSAISLAASDAQPARVDRVHTARAIADDFAIDQWLVAVLPAPTEQPETASDLRVASVGLASRSLSAAPFNAIWPTRGQITTYFGEVGPLSPHGHTGIDIAGPVGTPVLATDDGEVLKAFWSDDGYGGLIILAHPSGYETWYGHLASLGVERGAQVKRADQIGLMGSSGLSTGSHLHFEVRQDGQFLDPLTFLSEANLQAAAH